MTKDREFQEGCPPSRRGDRTAVHRSTDGLEGLGARMDHEPVAKELLAHLRNRYRDRRSRGGEAKCSQDLRVPHRPQ